MPEPIVVTDGAGDRYVVVGYSATFTLRSLDRPDAQPLIVDSATLRTLGVEWDGRVLNPAPAPGETQEPPAPHIHGERAHDSPRWCDRCQAWGDHHTDRCTRPSPSPDRTRDDYNPNCEVRP